MYDSTPTDHIHDVRTDISIGEATDIDEHDRLAAQQKNQDVGIAANTVSEE